MRVLCMESAADGLLDLAIRAKAAGHSVKFHCGGYDQHRHPVGKGLVEHVADWRQWVRWADLTVCGSSKWAIELDRFRALGIPIIGGCADVVQLELDRLAGMNAFKKHGIATPPYRQCRTLMEAIEYVEKRGEGCAVKPCGDVSDKSTSVVGKTDKEVIWRLKRWHREGKSFPQGLIVQDLVKGVEFAVGAWCGPAGFADGIEENWEEKKLYAGGLGPNTGESGTVMRLVKRSKLFDRVLKPFEDFLVSSGYVGNIDVNCIVDDDGLPWPLEFTCRLGWPAFNIELALHSGDPVEFLYELASGQPRRKSRRIDELAVGVVCAIPPYPYGGERREDVVNVPIWGITPSIEDSLHFANVMRGSEADGAPSATHYDTSGSYVLVSTGVGETVTEARRRSIQSLDRLTIPVSPFWRPDIGVRLRSQLDRLQEHGFAVGMRYA